jgi:hypothetical protein
MNRSRRLLEDVGSIIDGFSGFDSFQGLIGGLLKNENVLAEDKIFNMTTALRGVLLDVLLE